MVSQSTFNFWARTFQITQFIYLPWLNHPTRIGLVVVPFCIDPVKISIIFGIYLLMYLENMILNTFDCFFSIAHTIHIVFIVFITIAPSTKLLWQEILADCVRTM